MWNLVPSDTKCRCRCTLRQCSLCASCRCLPDKHLFYFHIFTRNLNWNDCLDYESATVLISFLWPRIVQRYSKLSKMSSFVPHAPKIRIKNFSKWTKKHKAKWSSNVCEKRIQKDYVMQKESNTRGLRNAERARKNITKILISAIVSCSFSPSLICPSMSIQR